MDSFSLVTFVFHQQFRLFSRSMDIALSINGYGTDFSEHIRCKDSKTYQPSQNFNWVFAAGTTGQGRPEQMRCPIQDLGVGSNARLKRGAFLNSDFMTSSCSVNRVTIVVKRKYAVQH